MQSRLRVAAFVVQSVLLGLAVAFLVVLVKPNLINTASDDRGPAPSYAAAVAASSRIRRHVQRMPTVNDSEPKLCTPSSVPTVRLNSSERRTMA